MVKTYLEAQNSNPKFLPSKNYHWVPPKINARKVFEDQNKTAIMAKVLELSQNDPVVEAEQGDTKKRLKGFGKYFQRAVTEAMNDVGKDEIKEIEKEARLMSQRPNDTKVQEK
jgi:hypothetical protein